MLATSGLVRPARPAALAVAVALTIGASLPAHAAPVTARPDTAVTTHNVPVTIDVLSNDDGASLALTGTRNGRCGDASVSDDKIVYTPTVGRACRDRFLYTVSDGSHRRRGWVEVTVLGRLGTVAGGILYVSTTSSGASDATSEQSTRGFFWVDANERGDALGDYGDPDGSGLFVRWASGGSDWVTPPAEAPEGGYGLVGVSGVNDEGVVTGWYFNADYTIAGTFLWSAEAGPIRFADSEPLDLIANTLDTAGTIVGYNEDYDVSGWSGFLVPAGTTFAEARLVQVPGWMSTQLFEINERGLLMGTVSEAPDAWDQTHPKTCFTAKHDQGSLTGVDVRERPEGVFYIDCRGLDIRGNVVGKYTPGTSADDRSRVHYALRWSRSGEFVTVHLPQPPAPEVLERREELLAVTNRGIMFGNIINDSFDDQTYVPVELTPVRARDHVTYADTPWDHVRSVLDR